MSRNLGSGVQGINGTAVAAILAGLTFATMAVKGSSPTATIRAWLSGRSPTGQALTVSPSGVETPPEANVGATGEQNKALGRILASQYGWSTGENWSALVSLWTRESNWNNKAKNPSSGAYGIAQALPPTKYPFAGQESGGSSAIVQMIWGMNYIKSRYGNPVAAWQHELSNNWY